MTSEFSVPDTSAGRLDKLQIPSQSFLRCRLRSMPRKEPVLGGKMLPPSSWLPSSELHFYELGMLLRAVFKGIRLRNIFLCVLKLSDITCFLVSPWTILSPCLKGEAENGLMLSSQYS